MTLTRLTASLAARSQRAFRSDTAGLTLRRHPHTAAGGHSSCRDQLRKERSKWLQKKTGHSSLQLTHPPPGENSGQEISRTMHSSDRSCWRKGHPTAEADVSASRSDSTSTQSGHEGFLAFLDSFTLEELAEVDREAVQVSASLGWARGARRVCPPSINLTRTLLGAGALGRRGPALRGARRANPWDIACSR